MEITKENIKALFYNSEKDKLIPQRMSKAYLERNHIPINEIKNYYSDSESFTESVYRMVYDIDIRPVCKVCGKKLEFKHGFSTFCSQACTNKDPEVLAKNKAGVSKSLKKAYAERGEEIKEKRAKSLGDISGSGSPFAIKKIQDKIKETIKERYGVENVLSLPEYHLNTQEKNRKKSIELWKSRGYDIEYKEDKIIIKNGCKIHGDIELSLSDFNNRMKESRRNYITVCPICNPIGYNQTSDFEDSVINIIKENTVSYELHDRKLIAPNEIDIVIPSLKIAIECNGIWWHKDGAVINSYHYNKYKKCENIGYKLVSIWDAHFSKHLKRYEQYINSICHENYSTVEMVEVKECNENEFIKFYNEFGICQLNTYANSKYYQVISGNKIIAVFSIDNNTIRNIFQNYNWYISNNAFKKICKAVDAKFIYRDNDVYYAINFGELTYIDVYKHSFYMNTSSAEYEETPSTPRSFKCYNSGMSVYKIN